MDSSKKHLKPSPEEHANIVSKLFYWWFLPFFNFGYKNDVQLKDIYNVSNTDLSQVWGDKLQKNWEIELLKKNPSLKTAISNTFLKPYSLSGIGLCIQYNFLKMILPITLAGYINYFNKEKSEDVGWLWATAVVLLVFIIVIINHSSTLSAQRIGMRARVAVCSLVYRKLLKLNHCSLEQTAAGQLVNLLSNDVQRFDLACIFLHFIWILPINAVISFYVMYCSVGIFAAAAGMGAIVLESIPIQVYMSTLQGKLRYQIAIRTDKRVKLMNEITSGIQVIKMYAWEKPFEKMVELCRKSEISFIAKSSYINGFLTAMAVFMERLSLYVTIVIFALAGKQITGDVVFSMAQLFNTIQLVMCIMFPRGLTCYAEVKVSIGRIEKFLLLDEIERKSITNDTANSKEPNSNQITCLEERNDKKDNGDIELHNITASWKQNQIVPTLVNLNLHIKSGTLCCVVGNVGAGKSSVLQLLLKELPVTFGKLSVNGTIAYASQEPWLFVSNVRNNILFGKPYDRHKYREVVRVCSLEKDFKQFPYGDKSLVGERGTSLSGGQRARVNLARAVYSEADIYLLDDPLSAVDTKVARHLFDVCIKGYLSDRTRILVTHQLQFMKDADLIVIINNGRIEKVGSFSDMTEKDLNAIQQEVQDEEKNETIEEIEIPPTKDLTSQSMNSLASIAGEEPEETDELIEKGNISTETYVGYWKAGAGILFLLLTFSMFIIAQIVTNSADIWVTHWVNDEVKRSRSNDNVTHSLILSLILPKTSDIVLPSNQSLPETTSSLPEISTAIGLLNSTMVLKTIDKINSTLVLKSIYDIKPKEYYIWMYTMFIFGSVILLTFRSFLYYYICMTASKVLHGRMFNNVLQAPMRFFDTNPSGRILSRFSKDMGAVDEILPRALIDTVQIFFVLVGILTMVFIVTPWMIFPTIVLGTIFYWFRVVYLKCAQAITRLEGTSKAPVFSHVSATLYGISTIRSSTAEQMLVKEFDVLQDQHTSTCFLFIASSTAFGFYLDIISTTFLAIVTYQFLIFENENTLSGSVGLVISQSLILSGMLQYGVRQSTDVASNMVSVERVMQYTKLEKEQPLETIGKKPPRDWPSKGKINFKNTYFRYAPELPLVLKDLNIEIGSAEKIGIVGRTGAGKSTLIASIFRLAPVDGTISIDDIDTAKLGLRDLRSNISIIPQEPVLFSASLRYNLDPFEKHNDSVLWEALEHVELKEALPDLNMIISEGGANLSAGQRQLICLARAIVKNNKILVMDEATANVDPQTDSLIQRTIRERFKDCTVLTIAHRLNTIMDSDRVLVMDAGQVMEFDHPYTLLQNSESVFTKMVNETGPEMADTLKHLARNAYLQNNEVPHENGVNALKQND